ncbi:MAG: hypothetical protein A2857_03370 [Candidatus Levybacteria bacterium RIFCSPHIGHO2_01_FULL_36_15]|nr:MAG: hypothetical protein A2857_03370 [Candidatus Levybacteria bacterium RIFCSPHIGHO2_01_FULL_36_15]
MVENPKNPVEEYYRVTALSRVGRIMEGAGIDAHTCERVIDVARGHVEKLAVAGTNALMTVCSASTARSSRSIKHHIAPGEAVGQAVSSTMRKIMEEEGCALDIKQAIDKAFPVHQELDVKCH